MRKYFQLSLGFTIVEVLLSVALFALIGSAFTVLFVQGWRFSQRTEQYDQASALAVEGVSALREIQNSSWQDLSAGTYGAERLSGVWTLVPAPTVIDGYTRTIELENVLRNASSEISPTGELDDETFFAVVSVSWINRSNQTQSVSFETYLSRWHASTGSIGSGGPTPTPTPAPTPSTPPRTKSKDSPRKGE